MLLFRPSSRRGLPQAVALTVALYASLLPAMLPQAGAHAAREGMHQAKLAGELTMPTCTGPHDLIVDGTQIVLTGKETFDDVCLIDGATVVAHNLTLRVGSLAIDAASRIDADGLSGGPPNDGGADCSPSGNGKANGDIGSPVTILARQAIVAGKITSNGGTANTAFCAEYQSGEDGGQGGQVTLEAAALTLTGSISSHGGDGGTLSTGNGGNGGAGGTSTLLAPTGVAKPTATFDVTGGRPGPPDSHTELPGTAGVSGQISVSDLTVAQMTALPPPPASLPQPIGAAPTILPVQTANQFNKGMQCGPGDLDVGKGVTRRLDGVRHFAHICVHDGGALITSGRLALIATTISIDAASRISADGVGAKPVRHVPTGQYPEPGSPILTRGILPAGTPGAPGTQGDICCGGTSRAPSGGAGGGALILVAGSIWGAGSITADGANGGKGDDGFGTPSNCAVGGQGAGGGSGGGIYIRAVMLQVSGHISATGGKGGPGGSDECNTLGTGRVNGGAHGGPGFTKILVNVLRVAGGPLPVDGPVALGRVLPVDPAPPTAVSGAQYFATAGAGALILGHTLARPFTAFYRRYGGLATFGYPRTEAFTEDGHLMQYTERFLLESLGDRMTTTPLGRQLTSARTFAPVTPFTTTQSRRYFASTRHSLSGPFLAYWLAHYGAVLLGAPIAEITHEQNGDGTGRTYQLQWFENGRLEYHPEAANPQFRVQLGLLGTQALEQRGWLP